MKHLNPQLYFRHLCPELAAGIDESQDALDTQERLEANARILPTT